jgi:two-component system sensor histidine kinase UhpB
MLACRYGWRCPLRPPPQRANLGEMSLFRRVVAINAGVLICAAVLLAVSPATVSPTLQLAEAVVLAVGTVLMISVNLVLMRRVFGPLEQLTGLMRRVDPYAPGRRLELPGADAEVAELRDSFNSMLDRLEDERRHSGRRALAAQENERRRLARELHDEIGQTLTGVVLQLEALQRMAPEALEEAIGDAQETARSGVEDMREIARGLRPQALDEFGLRSALVSLASQVSDHTGARVRPQLAEKLPSLAHEQDLAIYRVAQESLTNVARHANARHVDLALVANDRGDVELHIRDDGRGIAPDQANGDGTGLAGMRERALLIGGRLDIRASEAGGTEVRLTVPAGETT